jgi:hypothetical protein
MDHVEDNPSVVVEAYFAPLRSNGRGVDHIENTVLLLLRVCMLQALPNAGRFLPSHCLATGLYLWILIIIQK